MTTRPPGPKGNPLLGSLFDFARSPGNFLLEIARQYGDVVYFRILNMPYYLLTNPDDIRELLVNQADKFRKSQLDYDILSRFLGNGLLTNEGASHKRQRRLAQPAFHSKRIQAYAETMVAYTEDLLDEWRDNEVRDVSEEMMRLTMNIVSKTLFSADPTAAAANVVGDAIHVLQGVSNRAYLRGFTLPEWLPTQDNRHAKAALTAYDHHLEQIIMQRHAAATDGTLTDNGDLLSMLMLARDEDGSAMSDKQLRDEVATLFAAGHETTSNALTWTWYALSQNPDVEARLHEELDEVLRGRTPTLTDLPNLPYTLMVIKETMRLYPPAWILSARTPMEDVTIGRTFIPKGSNVTVAPYAQHRLARYFPDPERFDPERFTPEREKQLPKYAYLPFGAGPRVCIGNSFAMMEAQLILATIAQRYRLRLAPHQEVKQAMQITLSPENGLKMRLETRAAASSFTPSAMPILQPA
ncbi:MAG: cytochrome P450 [Chloroflexi bacterium]|nr:cytochrome P450 [Chloroflexota bacterium]MBP8056876.1 cytochrome P450 [Chloroflexota bacterium]